MNTETTLQLILAARKSEDLQPAVDEVGPNAYLFRYAHELARSCLATLCMHPLLTTKQAQHLLDACGETTFFLARNATLLVELQTNPEHLNDRSRALLERIQRGRDTSSPSMEAVDRVVECSKVHLENLHEFTHLELRAALLLALAKQRKRDTTALTALTTELTKLAPRGSFSEWRKSSARYRIICALLAVYATDPPGDARDALRGLLRELGVNPWECEEFLKPLAEKIYDTAGYWFTAPAEGVPSGEGSTEVRDALINWTLHYGTHVHNHVATPLFQWFLKSLDITSLLHEISIHGTSLSTEGVLKLTVTINALKKEHERRKNEAPSTSRSTEALPRDL